MDKPAPPAAENSAGTAKPRGRPFAAGQSGNPGGRPKADAEFLKLARERSIPALQKLTSIMLSGSGSAAVRAAEIIIDRAWGKAPQKNELTGADGKPLNGPPVTFMIPPNGRDVVAEDDEDDDAQEAEPTQ